MMSLEALAKALAAEDELGVVIRAHLFLERELNTFIGARVPVQVLDVLKLTYSRKVDVSITLGLPSFYAPPLHWVGKKRNLFAHHIETTLTTEDAKAFHRALTHSAPSTSFTILEYAPLVLHGKSFAELSPREQFSTGIVFLWGNMLGVNKLWSKAPAPLPPPIPSENLAPEALLARLTGNDKERLL